VEHATTHELPRGYDKRIFGESAVTIYRQEPKPEPSIDVASATTAE
jgi:hypothetical protein